MFQIHKTDRCDIFFFGVEKNGGLGKEAETSGKNSRRANRFNNLSADRSGAANSSCESLYHSFVVRHPPPHQYESLGYESGIVPRIVLEMMGRPFRSYI